MRQFLLLGPRVGLWLALALGPADALAVTYVAPLESAGWQVQQSQWSCRLRQSIPLYGDAVFEAYAGGAGQQFMLEPSNNLMESGFAKLVAEAPFWNAALQPVALGPVPVYEGKRPLWLDDELAQQVLKALDDGLVLGLERPSRQDAEIPIRVEVVPVRFRQAHAKYRDCLAQLSPISREQAATTVLEFGPQETQLSDALRGRLDALLRYAKESGKTALAIDAWSSETPRRLENLRLSRERAAAVGDYLVERGIARDSISSAYRGERDKQRRGRVTVRLHSQAADG